jgi:hypothetical protein
MFYTNIVPVLANLSVLATAGFSAAETLVWLPGLLIFGPIGMYLGIVAVKHASAALHAASPGYRPGGGRHRLSRTAGRLQRLRCDIDSR